MKRRETHHRQRASGWFASTSISSFLDAVDNQKGEKKSDSFFTCSPVHYEPIIPKQSLFLGMCQHKAPKIREMLWYFSSVGSYFRDRPEDLSAFWVWRLLCEKKLIKFLKATHAVKIRMSFKKNYVEEEQNMNPVRVEPSRSAAQKFHQAMHEALEIGWIYGQALGQWFLHFQKYKA